MGKKPRRYGVVTEKSNTLLIDGNALFKRGFLGAKDQYNSNGDHIGGIFQFITIVRKLLKESLYHRAFVFWDGAFSGRMRWEIYSDYKVSRDKDFVNGSHPVDEQEVTEKFIIRQYLEELFIRQYMDETKAGVEADDFIALYCSTKEKGETITICTSDRDLCQLINGDVQIYLCDLKEYVTESNYNKYFKHHVRNSKLIKIIGGDQSDDIKGVSGVKEPTLLKHFPDLIKREMTLEEVIAQAKILQYSRIDNKQKPLKALTNIILGVTDGVQGDKLYETNELLVDLSTPLVNEENVKIFKDLKGPIGDIDSRGIKNVYTFMKRDGIDKSINNFSTEYLLPFKELIEREKKQSK